MGAEEGVVYGLPRSGPKPYSVSVLRGVGHPWQTQDKDWDMMIIKAVTREGMGKVMSHAEKSGWKQLCVGFDGADDQYTTACYCAVFYKPQLSGPGHDWAEDDRIAWPPQEDWK